MKQEIIDSLKNSKYELAALLAFVEVETGGQGFDPRTGKIMIQFEPSWFKKKAPYSPSGLWSLNKVEVQSKEWLAFNDAFKKDPNAAMESTSIGLGQIMGFHYERLGYKTVGEMWDDAKLSIKQQCKQLIKFIETDRVLSKALKLHDWDKVASIYNGKWYRLLAVKYHRVPYDKAMESAYNKYKKMYK